MKKCFFLGYRDAPNQLQGQLNSLVDLMAARYQVTEFIVGHFGNFDRMATAAVQNTIRKYPEKGIRALMLQPYLRSELDIPLPDLFEYGYCPSGTWFASGRDCVEKASILVLEESDCLVACCGEGNDRSSRIFHRAKQLQQEGKLLIWNLVD